MRNLLIAIDQGGTKTDILVLSKTGKIHAYANDKHIRQPNDDFDVLRYSYISRIVEDTLASLNSSMEDVDYILAAMCGADWEDDYLDIQNKISCLLGLPHTRIIIVNDSIAALYSGITNSNTDNFAVLCAGTRLNCSLLGIDGKTYTYGRFINNIDHGAYAMGQQAWEAIIESYNGFQRQTILEKLFLQYYEANSLRDLYKGFTSNKFRFSPSLYAPLLLEAADYDDKIAKEILDRFAYRWIRYVVNGLPKIGLTGNDRFTLILAGGIFQNRNKYLTEQVAIELHRKCPNAQCQTATLKPIAGAALMLLRKYSSQPINEKTIDRLIQTVSAQDC